MISYRPLFETMKQKNISSYRLNQEGLSRGTYDRIKQNKLISLHSVDMLCKMLNCKVEDIVEYIDDDEIKY